MGKKTTPKSPRTRKARSKTVRAGSASKEISAVVPGPLPPARLGRLSDQVGYLLRRASSVFTTHWNLQFAGESVVITPVQCGMMLLIDENPGLTQIELARMLKVEGSTLWQLIARLLELGFIHRYRVPEDQRAFAIHLSRSGRQALQKFEAGLHQHQSLLLECLSEKERGDLAALLMRVIESGDRLNERTVDVQARERPRRKRA